MMSNNPLRFLSVFAGIGGFDLGCEAAGWQCAGQIEINPFSSAVLEKHWPEVWRHDDVRTATGELIRSNCGRIDAVIGGVPCQPASLAGKRKGSADDRWLWPDYLRLVSEVEPLFMLAENPVGILSLRVDRLAFPEWLAREREAIGYELLPVKLSAESVGANHRRERVFFVAYSASVGHGRKRLPVGAGAKISAIERGSRQALAYASSPGREERDTAAVSSFPAHTPRRIASGFPASPGQHQHEWEQPRTQPKMGSSANGISFRLARYWRRRACEALGNAIVPQQAKIIAEGVNGLVAKLQL